MIEYGVIGSPRGFGGGPPDRPRGRRRVAGFPQLFPQPRTGLHPGPLSVIELAPSGHAARRMRVRRRSNVARPYICLLIIVMRLTLRSWRGRESGGCLKGLGTGGHGLSLNQQASSTRRRLGNSPSWPIASRTRCRFPGLSRPHGPCPRRCALGHSGDVGRGGPGGVALVVTDRHTPPIGQQQLNRLGPMTLVARRELGLPKRGALVSSRSGGGV